MKQLRQDAFAGLEFDWFAIDCAGHLALCASAGWGEIPPAILEAASAGSDGGAGGADPSRDLIQSLAEAGGHRCEAHGPGACGDWRLLGNRGLYVYDWVHWAGPYTRIIVPEVPVSVQEIGADLLASLNAIAAPHLRFADCSTFDGGKLGAPE